MSALSLLIYAAGFFLVVIGFAWVPCAYRICHINAATGNRLPYARRYALAGALYSASMFLPWIYLIVKMSRREFPMSLIIAAYVFQSTIWCSINFSLWISNNSVYSDYSHLVSLSMVAATLTWVVLLFASDNKCIDNSYAVDGREEYLPGIRPILSFVWTTTWFIASAMGEYPMVLLIISAAPITLWASSFFVRHLFKAQRG